jgi:monoamine oxidase
MSTSPNVLIVGGGFAGKGGSFQILKTSDGLGGRVRRTDEMGGFLLDRGFQVTMADLN